MKKKILPISLIIIFIIAIGSIVWLNQNAKENNLILVTGEEILKKIDQKESFILVVTQDGCSHCEEYKPILNQVLTKNNIKAFELDLTKLKKENTETRNSINKLFNISGTPTTIFINDGIEKTTINRLVGGGGTYNSIESSLKDRGFIK